ncbi:hypothetical protein V5O48_005374 [Marasmius crinis-equi]|uniref:Uncharacterized protein n=1 Tax=Marasmius crinis-equi TaxID=585013 RepID=A0ABR3FNE9_9AGAR
MTSAKKPADADLQRHKVRKRVARLQSKLYRERNPEEYRAKARERMARKRAEMTQSEKEGYLAQQREHSRQYYDRNRNEILDKRELARYKTYQELHGKEGFNANYRFRDVRPRELLDLKARDPENYEREQEAWQTQKQRRLEEFRKMQ